MNAVDADMLIHIEAVWDDVIGDKILRADEVSSPTSTEPFFFDAPSMRMDSSRTPSPVRTSKRTNGKRARQPSWCIASQLAHGNVEPSDEPCSEEIPWSDIVFWLGNATGQVECSCSTCVFQRSRGCVPLVGPEHHAHAQMYIPWSVFHRLSTKIPLVAMPRIEGVN